MNMEKIDLSHGNGGKFSHDLIEKIFIKEFNNEYINKLNDSAFLNLKNTKLAFTTDSYVVKPIFFPGGDIGKLAVTGTVNDLAVSGALPKFISCGIILEEGFKIKDLQDIIKSMQETARQAGVEIVTGDTKVVEKGSADGIFINTSGIGIIEDCDYEYSINNIKIGDEIIINGYIGDHGVAVLEEREEIPMKSGIKSDCVCLNDIITKLIKSIPRDEIRIMRDPTRGGLAQTLNEFVYKKNFTIELFEDKIPIRDEVKAICEITGFDPFYIANEGKFVIVCSDKYSNKIINILKNHPLGNNASVIGKITDISNGNLVLNTNIGGSRIIDMLVGNMLPRIC